MKVVILLGLVSVSLAAKLGRVEHIDPLVTPTPVPKPYNFGFEVRDDLTTNYHNRAESSDATGHVKGSYSYVLPDGFVYTVSYEDKNDGNGLTAVVRKEPSGIQVIIPTRKPEKEPLNFV